MKWMNEELPFSSVTESSEASQAPIVETGGDQGRCGGWP